MIDIDRGPEPERLAALREGKLAGLRRILVTRPLAANDIEGYRELAEDIWRAQHHKCCYCETILHLDYNDVEHFRPKAEADRGEHCQARHGYWWLAFTWGNLLFSCPGCNRGKGKGIQFPLAVGSTPLDAFKEEHPPGGERPLLLDPALDSGIEHIEFKPWDNGRWRPVARNGSPKGDKTITVCRLDREDLIELYAAHVRENVLPEVHAVREAVLARDKRALHKALWWADKRLLRPSQPYVGLSYDALVHHVPNEDLASFSLTWFRPSKPGTTC